MCHMSYEEATPHLLSMWECILYVYLCGGAYCMFTYVGAHTVCLPMWGCILYVYPCGVHTVCLPMWGAYCMFTYVTVHTVCLPMWGAYCMFNFITIIKPTMKPSIRRVRKELLFCEPNPIHLTCSDVPWSRKVCVCVGGGGV